MGTPRLFSNFQSIFFVEFLTFNIWNCSKGTKNYVYRRQFLISSIYRVKKRNIKFTPFPSISRPQTASSLDPIKIG